MFKRGIHIVYAIGVVSTAPLYAVPVVPNFTQGSMTSVTTQTTGWTYSVSGHGVEPEGGFVSPDNVTTQSNTVDGVNSTWTGLDLSTTNKPNWKQTEAGNNFSFLEHYSGPGLQTHTIIQRETTIQSVTESTSIFSN